MKKFILSLVFSIFFSACLISQADYRLKIKLPVHDTIFSMQEDYIDVSSGVFLITARFNIQKVDSAYLEEKALEIEGITENLETQKAFRQEKKREVTRLLRKFGKIEEASAGSKNNK